MLPTQASVVVQHPDSQVALQQAYCFVYGSITHGMPGPQQAPLHGVSPVGPVFVRRRAGISLTTLLPSQTDQASAIAVSSVAVTAFLAARQAQVSQVAVHKAGLCLTLSSLMCVTPS